MEVCIVVKDPPDIGEAVLYLQVVPNTNTSFLPGGASIASKKTKTSSTKEVIL